MSEKIDFLFVFYKMIIIIYLILKQIKIKLFIINILNYLFLLNIILLFIKVKYYMIINDLKEQKYHFIKYKFETFY